MSTSTFRGYSTDLLRSIKHHGKALVGDDDLYAAAQAYTDPALGGGMYGPALLDTEPKTSSLFGVSRTPLLPVPPTPPGDDEEEDEDEDPWAALGLLQLRDLLRAHRIEYPRTMTRGGAIKRLEAAGITPPPG